MNKICRFCNNSIEYNTHLEYARHCSGCSENPNRGARLSKIGVYLVERNEYTFNCLKCNKEYKLILSASNFKNGKYNKNCSIKCAHSRLHSEETKIKLSNSAKNSIKVYIANKSKIKNLINITCPICKIVFQTFPSEKQIYCSRKCYLLEPHKKHGSGGVRLNSGRGKSGWYKGIYCGSSWELAWVIYNIEHNIKFERNIEGFKYEYDNKYHEYFPDFKLIDTDTYIEVKGFKRIDDDSKWNQFPHKLIILFKKDLKNVFEYVINKYGANYINLYDINYKNRKINKCKICGNACKYVCCSRICAGKLVSKNSPVRLIAGQRPFKA
jgi:hypothetical protein